MHELDVINAITIASISSYLTTIVLSETEPFINDDGEEEYTLPGYLLVAGSYLIKLPLKFILKLIGALDNHKKVVEEEEETTSNNEYILNV